MKLGEIVVHMDNYNFTKFHQNQMKNKKSFINNMFFCSEFQSVSRIVKTVHSGIVGQNGLRRVSCERWIPHHLMVPFYTLIAAAAVVHNLQCIWSVQYIIQFLAFTRVFTFHVSSYFYISCLSEVYLGHSLFMSIIHIIYLDI